MNRAQMARRRNQVVVALFILLTMVACSLPSCGRQPGPSDGTPLPPTVNPASLPPTNPEVVAQRPYPGEELPLDGSIDLYFDQPMDKTTVEGALSFDPAINVQLVWVDDSTLRVTPEPGALERAARYDLTIGEAAASEQGLKLAAPFEAEIQTVGFLQVGEVVPGEGTEAVETDTVITVFFNRPVVPLVVAEDMPGLPQPLSFSPDVPGTGEWVNTSIYMWHPAQPLAGGQTYTVTVDGSLSDQMGGVMEVPYSWSFTTLPPNIVAVNPAEATREVVLDQKIEVTFNQPMDHATSEAAFSLVETGSNTAIPGTFSWDEGSRIMSFTPSGLLPLDGRFQASVQTSALSANGQASLIMPITWTFEGVHTPAVNLTEPANGATVPAYSGIRVVFTAPMDEDSLVGLLVTDPPLPDDVTIYYSSYDYSMYVNAPLEPSTTYTATLQPGARDPYGNTITTPFIWSFTTEPLPPMVQLNVQGTFGLYDAARTTELFLLHRNVDQIFFSLARLDLQTFNRLTGPDSWDDLEGFTPSPEELVRQWTLNTQGELNVPTYIRVPIVSDDGGSLQPGIYLLSVDAPQTDQQPIKHFVIVTDANLTLKSSFDETLVWLTDLSTGQPVSGAPVTFYNGNFQEIASGTTDADGVASVQTPHVTNLWDLKYAIVDDGTRFAVAMTEWNEGLNAWDFGVPAAYEFEALSVYVYTDRPLYRPGQEVFFKGVVRDKNDVAYSVPGVQSIDVWIYNDQGDEITHQTLPLSDVGTFNGSITLSSEAGLGYYSIEAELGPMRFGRGFQVAEYRKPEFLVEVTPAEAAVLAGGSVDVTVDAEFFFGGPVSEAGVTYNVLADEYFFQYEGGATYSFADFDYDAGRFDEDFVPGFGQLIEEGTGTTNADGEFVISLPASLDDTNTSRRLTIEAGVTDVNGVTVYGRTEVIIHKAEYYVGIRPDVYVGREDEEFTADVLVVDWEGNEIADTEVTIEMMERRWSSVQEEDDQGRTQWVWSVENIPVGRPITVRTNDLGRAEVALTPPTGGAFKILATVEDTHGNEQASSTIVWVSGSEYVAWRQQNNDRIDLISDKQTYRPGETAEILIPSPYQGDDVQALITIERGSILRHEVITLPSNSYVYRLPITGDLAPNVFVSVVIVKGVDSTNTVASFKMGVVQIQVDPVEQTLDVDVRPDRDKVGPGEVVTFTVTTKDSSGTPVDAEVSLALVDLATLSLAPPNSGPILEHFYGAQLLGVRTAVPLAYLVDRRNQELFDQGKGGGGGGGEGFFDVRTNFKDTAYWTAQVRTGEDGSEVVSVTLPDNLTTWRMDARGVTSTTLVGDTTVDVIATKPLLVRPVTPRFFTVGDEVTLGVVVNNNTAQSIDAAVKLDAQGVTITGDAEQRVSIPANGRVEVQWPVTVNAGVEWVNLVFSAEGGGLTDASKPPLGDPANDQMLPVYKYEVPETVGTAGQLTDAQARTEGIVLPPTYEVTQGQVRVQIDPSLAASTLDGLTYLRHFKYECTEQIVSKFLPNALTMIAFRQFNIQDQDLEANLDQQVRLGLQKLYAEQHVDGGWGWWVQGPSNATVTAYVIQGMVAAREAGFEVEQRVIDEGVRYLNGELRPLDMLDDHSKLDRQAYILYVLAKAGQPDVSRTVQMYENRQGLQHWARALLAQTLWMIDPQDARLNEIQADLVSSAIVSATGAHWEEDEPDYWNWNTDTRSTAIILDTFALIWPAHDLAPNITRWLMVARTAGHWETTQETAWALIGLTHWMTATGELQPDYTWRFSFNGAELAGGNANATTVRDSEVITINVQDLVKDEVNRLLFERTAGAGRMYYTAHLTAYLPVEEVDPLSRGVVVSRRYLDADGNVVTEGRVGDIITVEVTLIAPNDLYYVVLEDPFPAGAEAVDTSLLTESVVNERPVLRPDDPLVRGWGWWWFSSTDLRDEKAVLSAEVLPAGTYQYTYQIRLGLAGTFRVIPTTAREFYFPEVYGRGDGMLFTILP